MPKSLRVSLSTTSGDVTTKRISFRPYFCRDMLGQDMRTVIPHVILEQDGTTFEVDVELLPVPSILKADVFEASRQSFLDEIFQVFNPGNDRRFTLQTTYREPNGFYGRATSVPVARLSGDHRVLFAWWWVVAAIRTQSLLRGYRNMQQGLAHMLRSITTDRAWLHKDGYFASILWEGYCEEVIPPVPPDWIKFVGYGPYRQFNWMVGSSNEVMYQWFRQRTTA